MNRLQGQKDTWFLQWLSHHHHHHHHHPLGPKIATWALEPFRCLDPCTSLRPHRIEGLKIPEKMKPSAIRNMIWTIWTSIFVGWFIDFYLVLLWYQRNMTLLKRYRLRKMSSASSIWWWLWLGKEIMGRWCWLEHTSSFGSRPFKTINPIGRISGVRFGSRHNRHWLVDVA